MSLEAVTSLATLPDTLSVVVTLCGFVLYAVSFEYSHYNDQVG